jgi:hypothetical protein
MTLDYAMLLNADVKQLHNKLWSRLPQFVANHIPASKSKLFPGVHWVWESFRHLLPKLCAVVLLNGHVVTGEELSLRTPSESLLKDKSKFIEMDGYDIDMDGNYIVLDGKRNVFIRSGCAEIGMRRRWFEHVNCSKMKTISTQKSVLYMSYPHEETREVNISKSMCKGKCNQLVQMVGVGFVREKALVLSELFPSDITTREHIMRLSGTGDRNEFVDKWYRHLCYCFECVYALMIDERANISSNPGFEWQLQYYGSE